MINPIFVAWNLYPNKTGGIEVFNFHFIKWLSKQEGISPTLVTASDTIEPEGIKVKKYNVRVKRFGNVINIFSFLKACVSIKGKNKVIFLSFSKSSWKLWVGYSIVASLLRIPYIIYIHGGGMYEWQHKTLMKSVFDNASSVFCVSPKQKIEYEKRSNSIIQVLPPIVPFSKFTPDRSILSALNLTNKDFIFLNLGSLRHIKGTDILIDAFRILGTFPLQNRIHLLFVGGGDVKKYESLTENIPSSQNIHFIGKVKNQEVGKYYAIADCFILPSRVEGMPIALIEALYNKLPIITSDLPTIPKSFISGSNCLKFPSENFQNLADQMKYIYTSFTKRNEISIAGNKLYKINWANNNTFDAIKIAMLKTERDKFNESYK